MYFDALSISAILISIGVMITVLILMRRLNRDMHVRMRQVAQHAALLHTNHSARELCVAIHRLHPDTCPGIDYMIKDDADGAGPYIKEWRVDAAKPSTEQIQRALRVSQPSGTEPVI